MAKVTSFKVPSQSNPLQTFDFPQGFTGGLNISVSPDQIAPNQSPDMVNCNYDGGGVPTKRFGLSKAYDGSLGTGPIRHMAEFARIGADTEFLIVHGGNIYKEVK